MDEATRQAFTDAWNLYKKYYNASRSDAFWKAFHQDTNLICSKYKDATLIRGLIQAVIADIERRLSGSQPEVK